MKIEEQLRQAHGMYDPRFEHDACGVGFIANLKGNRTHGIVAKGLEILENLEHRGAVGADPLTGDGAGIVTQIPDAFFRKECAALGITLPAPGDYGAGIVFLPQDGASRNQVKALFNKCAAELGLNVLGWRTVPTDNSGIGETAKSAEPFMEQAFIGRPVSAADELAFERKLFVLRKYAKKTVLNSGIKGSNIFFCLTLSSRTIAYKGMFTTAQLKQYYPDLQDTAYESALALVHSRFSTNTFPTWRLAHPFRYLAHNGEINTLRGNINWMKAREAVFEADLFTKDEIDKLVPIINEKQSDSATLDNVVELLHLSGRSLPHVMMMLIPEAWTTDEEMDPKLRAFYEYHATLMEPWDGPAAVAFTDGHIIGATLDRNGLRPSRFMETDDGILVMASEAGVLDYPEEKITRKGWLRPGRMFLASVDEHRIISNREIKEKIAAEKPHEKWLEDGKITLSQMRDAKPEFKAERETLVQRQAAFGITEEDIKVVIAPMANTGAEPIGSMGAHTPLAVLSSRPQMLFSYFYQLFAQVTNPPIDPIRELNVMSLVSFIGKVGQILREPGRDNRVQVVELPHPVLNNLQLEKLRQINVDGFRAANIPITFDAKGGPGSLEKALADVCARAMQAVERGDSIIVLSDRTIGPEQAAIPSLLAVAAVHHHLIRAGGRTRCGIIIETGEAFEVHHFGLLLGYGASAVNPYLAFETIEEMHRTGTLDKGVTPEAAEYNYMKGVDKGLLKIISKMGISTIQSYIGAQIFEAVGLSEEFVEKYFTGTPSRIGGIGIEEVAQETLMKHRYAWPDNVTGTRRLALDPGGFYNWRARGEDNTYSPEMIQTLQKSTRLGDYPLFKKYTAMVNGQNGAINTIRSLVDFKAAAPVPLEQVEPAENIVKRFFTGAMSFGSISKEAHETIAIAMNRIGAKSNCGEGGEDPARFKPLSNGDSARSAIKQVASGRFGVTSNYLVNADEIQIKMAQGAKPGEGGQLPGPKVDKVIAATRHSTPGVGLISPPPHHDIYSIEDLAQLIFDLKNANANARINVKLVSEAGVGTVAAGVAKGHSEAVLISGHDGGTGASPISSIKRAGLPWELGVAETHQVLMRNNLRSRIVVQTDGRVLTGRDIAIATLLGAEEWGAATSALVVSGCIMMRKCHLNNCPVGVATQDPDLRKNFTGKPEHVVNYFMFLAQELRELMAQLGFRTVNEMVGRADMLKAKEGITHWKAKHVKLDRILMKAESAGCASYCSDTQDFGLDAALDHQLIRQAKPALDGKKPVSISIGIRNVNRTFGAMLSAEISRAYGEEGLPDNTIRIKASGSAGQSFGAFGARGITLELEGEANDYVGKGLSGARLIFYPPHKSVFNPHENIIVGNVAFYGATKGEAYIRGRAGERFCVRNSGADVVVEAVGDNGCEYMTGGRVVILGPIGKNFAAGMSGGIAYILDDSGMARQRINTEMVALEKMDAADEAAVKGMIERHLLFTGSFYGKKALDGWDDLKTKVIKVMPVEYKRVLAEMAAEKTKKTAAGARN